MAYATQQDIITAYGPDALHGADRDGDGLADADAVARALDTASSEIDSYIGVRHQVPLASPPDIIRQYAIDIALYRIASSADLVSEEIRKRYDDAISALRRIAKGEAELIIESTGGEEGDDTLFGDDAGPRPIVTGGPERVFSRDKMEGL